MMATAEGFTEQDKVEIDRQLAELDKRSPEEIAAELDGYQVAYEAHLALLDEIQRSWSDATAAALELGKTLDEVGAIYRTLTRRERRQWNAVPGGSGRTKRLRKKRAKATGQWRGFDEVGGEIEIDPGAEAIRDELFAALRSREPVDIKDEDGSILVAGIRVLSAEWIDDRRVGFGVKGRDCPS